jgi:hypothetical protein
MLKKTLNMWKSWCRRSLLLFATFCYIFPFDNPLRQNREANSEFFNNRNISFSYSRLAGILIFEVFLDGIWNLKYRVRQWNSPAHCIVNFFEICNLVQLLFMTMSFIEKKHQSATACRKRTGDEMHIHYQRPVRGKEHY